MSPSGTLQSLSARLSGYLQKLHLGAILAIAGLLRVASIFVLKTYFHPQTWEFGLIANSINQGFGFSLARPIRFYTDPSSPAVMIPTATMPPAYPYILAWFLRTFGDKPGTYLAIEFVNVGLAVLLVYLVYRIARALLSENAAKLAALICAVYPAQVYMCNEFHSISFYIVLGVAAVFFLNRYLNESNAWSDTVWAGLCMGVLLYFRSESLALMFIYAACLLVRKGMKALGPAILFVSISLMCVSPWIIRNYRVFHAFVPTMSTGGFGLWLGNNPSATGSQHYDSAKAVDPVLLSELDKVSVYDRQYELELDNFFKQDAIAYIRTHPRREVELAGKKLFLFFVFDPAHVKGTLPSYWVPSILMTFVAVYGAYLQRRKLLREDLLLSISILTAVLLGMVLEVLPRYKMVVDPFIMIFAAAVVDRHLAKSTQALPSEAAIEAKG